MSAGIIPVKSDKIDAYKAREGFFVVCQKAIPIKAIIKHAMSVFAHPPIPYLMLSPKRRIACSADAPASHMATVSCCANREACRNNRNKKQYKPRSSMWSCFPFDNGLCINYRRNKSKGAAYKNKNPTHSLNYNKKV